MKKLKNVAIVFLVCAAIIVCYCAVTGTNIKDITNIFNGGNGYNNIQIGVISIDLSADFSDMGGFRVDTENSGITLNLWTIIILIIFVAFLALSIWGEINKNSTAAILSLVALVFPFVFGSSIMKSYVESIEAGASPADLVGSFVFPAMLLGLAMFVSPVVMFTQRVLIKRYWSYKLKFNNQTVKLLIVSILALLILTGIFVLIVYRMIIGSASVTAITVTGILFTIISSFVLLILSMILTW